MTVYLGIDEAGFGPILGPMCTAAAVFRHAPELAPTGRVRDSHRSSAVAPDLWSALASVVCRTPAEAQQRPRSPRIAIADSKKLKLPNAGKHHPLTHLERGVLCWLAASTPGDGAHAAEPIDCVQTLLDRLGCAGEALPSAGPWYGGAQPSPASDAGIASIHPDAGEALPLATPASTLRMLAARLRACAQRAGVELVEIRCVAMDERRLNERIRALGTKHAAAMHTVGGLLGRTLASHAARAASDDPTLAPLAVVDRQGGRTRYAGELAHLLPGAEVHIEAEHPAASAYVVRDGASGARLRVRFEVEAEQRHLPVALASMTAKLVRELFMRRFNAYWCARIAELKPTAGYLNDGKRWLNDAWPHLTDDERRVLPRRA